MHVASQKLIYSLLTDVTNFYDIVDSFSCDNPSVDRYLKTEAFLDHYEFQTNTTLIFSEDNELLAYFTIKEGSVKIDIEGYSPPCVIIERLGVMKQAQGKGVGTSILQFIASSSEMLNQRFMSLDSIWECKEFYNKRGFIPFIAKEFEEPTPSGCVYMFMDLYDEEKVTELYTNP